MTVALLSCGPSLAKYPGPARFGIVIAVNKVVVRHACDHWSVGDYESWAKYASHAVSLPALWTHPDTLRRIERHRGCKVEARTYLRDERSAPWTLFSATAALWLAGVGLGAKRVECFGCDMGENGADPARNWDGSDEPTANRSESRWERERRIWGDLVNELNGRGVEVVRHGHS